MPSKFVHIKLLAVLIFSVFIVPKDGITQPIPTRDISPFVAMYGLPGALPASVLTSGAIEFRLHSDLANNATWDAARQARVVLDGETVRNTLAARIGVGGQFEVGLEIPVVKNTAGTTDKIIRRFHSIFGIPQGSRNTLESDRFLYQVDYSDGRSLTIREHRFQIGDIGLRAGLDISEITGLQSALWIRIDLPTGNTATMVGNGQTDLAAGISIREASRLLRNRLLHLYGTGGFILPGNRSLTGILPVKNVLFFHSGADYEIFSKMNLLVQIDAHTPFYEHQFEQLGSTVFQLNFGGSIHLSEEIGLSLTVAEDIAVSTSSDVIFRGAVWCGFPTSR
ncbi:MAG: DUF3187 family protein [Candidatus Marinimicrobia bacterium]|nr:DUF3187 family protein [Candidatus Neomarinimicrobiota bacterium]MCF7827608.1 DUF3187 family protein [Candidatus Neomarinimicrobiota bacterium]MCF7881531.1 DUF3187 family protein [Candidatus Neomarinimicrobiota bacterium]